jgi:phage shock protein C
MRRLTRKRERQIIGGVTTGVAAYLGIDPIIVRLIALFLFITTGFVPLTIVYIAALLMVPYDDDSKKV